MTYKTRKTENSFLCKSIIIHKKLHKVYKCVFPIDVTSSADRRRTAESAGCPRPVFADETIHSSISTLVVHSIPRVEFVYGTWLVLVDVVLFVDSNNFGVFYDVVLMG